MSTFGQELRALRRARKLTVNQLAVYSGISSATISKIENGKRGTPKPATIKKLAAVLKIPHENLMAAAGHITAFPEEIREASEGYQSIYAIYQTAVTRGAGTCLFLTARNGSTSQKRILKISANTSIF